MKIKINDVKPQVGIFEIVDGVFLSDTEDNQLNYTFTEYFDGEHIHLHAQDIKTLVKYSPYISEETKQKFANSNNEYLNYPRGRVDYNTKTRKYEIMAAKKFFTEENIEKVTREFHLPPYSSGDIILVADDGHYGY